MQCTVVFHVFVCSQPIAKFGSHRGTLLVCSTVGWSEGNRSKIIFWALSAPASGSSLSWIWFCHELQNSHGSVEVASVFKLQNPKVFTVLNHDKIQRHAAIHGKMVISCGSLKHPETLSGQKLQQLKTIQSISDASSHLWLQPLVKLRILVPQFGRISPISFPLLGARAENG